mmetsp:Transcript_35643/g.89589  ORF Transcript_35643/g.89589 Transcript_35643/m.89589 type:complete len:275 (-) Transcript_35643:664-1488(-)
MNVHQREHGGGRVERHLLGHTGDRLRVCAGEGAVLLFNKSPAGIPQAFRGSTLSGDVIIKLVLPVRPRVEVLIGGSGGAVDLPHALLAVRARAEFGEERAAPKSACIVSTFVDQFAVERVTWRAGQRVAVMIARVLALSAAVHVIAQHAGLRRPGQGVKSNRGHQFKDAVREGGGFVKYVDWGACHQLRRLVHRRRHPLVQGLQPQAVCAARYEQTRVIPHIAGPGLVDDVDTDDGWDGGQGSHRAGPVAHKQVLQGGGAVERLKRGRYFRRCV